MIWALTNEKINALRGERNKLGPSPNDCHPLIFYANFTPLAIATALRASYNNVVKNIGQHPDGELISVTFVKS